MDHLPGPVLPARELTGNCTILLIDDDEFLLVSTRALIERMGFTLLTAMDGVEAVEVFQQHRGEIGCVITDLTMPRMDGWETLTALRRLDPTLPVILSSGYDKAQVMSGSHPDQPQGFLGKPYGLQQLRNAINHALAVSERSVT
jgi:CheY-like chemotaxis protein